MAYIFAKFLEGFYSVHIKFRYLHDKVYARDGAYKKWSDKPYSRSVHRGLVLGFVVSFIIFSTLTNLFPDLFDISKPRTAQAGSNSKIWTTREDFESAATNSNVDQVSTPGSVKLSSNITDSLLLFYEGENSPEGWEIVSDELSEPYYQKFVLGSDVAGNVGGAPSHTHPITGNTSSNGGGITKTDGLSGVSIGSRTSDNSPHSHSLNITSESASNLPLFRDMKIIKKIGNNNLFMLPEGAIIMFDSAIPSGWNNYSSLDMNSVYPRGSSINGTINEGSADHSHNFTGSTASLSGYVSRGPGIYSATVSAHSHSLSGSNLPSPNEPAYYGLNFVKVGTGGAPLVSGMITFFENTPASSYWQNISSIGQPMNGKLPRGSLALGTSGGSSAHGHTINGSTITTQNGNVSQVASDTNSYRLIPTHSHTLDGVTTTSSTSMPPYITAIFAKLTNIYATPATLGSPAASSAGLRVDSGEYTKAKAASLTWSGTTNAAGQKILFKVRAGDSQAELDTNQCYGPSALDSGCADWSTAGKFFSQTYNAADPPNPLKSATGIFNQIPAKRYIEVLVRLESDGTNTPVLDDVTLTYDTLEAPPNSNLSLQKTNGDTLNTNTGTQVTNGTPGGYTNETSLKVTSANLTCTDCGITPTNLRLEVEAKPVGTAFTGTGTIEGTSTNNGNGTFSSTATLTGLLDATSYHLQMRSIDAEGRISGWTSYGNNAESEADFTIEQTSPTGTVTIGGANVQGTFAKDRNVTLAISAIDTGGSNLAQMRISNDGEFNSPEEDWQTYAPTLPWTLAEGGDGERNVYFQFRDNAGNVTRSIFHTTTADFQSPPPEINNSSNELKLSNSTFTILSVPSVLTNSVQGGYDVQSVNYSINGATRFNFDWMVEGYYGWGAGYSFNDGANWNWSGYCYDPDEANCPGPLQNVNSGWINIPNGVNTVKLRIFGEWGGTGYPVPYINNLLVVRDGYAFEGTYLSGPFSNPGKAKQLSWNSITTSPNAGQLTVRLQGGDDAEMANSLWTDYLDSNETVPEIISKKSFLRYELRFVSGNNDTETPVLYDINLELAKSASITLDTQPPTAFSLSSPANNTWSSTVNSPTFTWGASSGHTKYELWIDGTKNGGDIASGTTTATPVSPLSEGNHTWTVKAFDEAGNITTATEGEWNYGYDTTVPGKPTSFTSTGASETITLNWSYPAGGAPLTTYLLERIEFVNYNPAEAEADWSGYGSYSSKTVNHPTQSAILSALTGTGFDLITQGTKYAFRISAKDTANAQYGAYSDVTSALTADTSFGPGYPQNVAVSPCDGTLNCSTKAGIPHKGYELKVTWSPAVDAGVGTSHYLVYRSTQNLTGLNYNDTTVRSSYSIVGVLPYTNVQSPTWYDNDANNVATTTFYDADGGEINISPEIQALTTKTTPSALLNDYVKYYYRIVAVDAGGNKTSVFPEAPTVESDYNIDIAKQNGNAGTDAERTPDVTAPQIPTNLTVTPTGVDSLNSTPNLTQAVDVAWSPSIDARTVGRTPTGTGIGNITYKLYLAKGNISGPTEPYTLTYTGATPARTVDGLLEDSYYYFKVVAIDGATNPTEANYNDYYSSEEGALTKNSQVPTTPTAVNITAKTGDSNTDTEVGYKLTISFTGSRIKGTGNRVDGYRVYRRTTNSNTRTDWTTTSAVCTFENLNIPADTQDPVSPRTCTDTVPTDATTYYYKVEAFGWNVSNTDDPNTQIDERVVYSPSLSAINVGTLHAGWDTTPDATAPATPASLAVKDIHGNEVMVRNIVTWQMISAPLRNGVSDFSRYRVYRFETLLGIGAATLIAEKTDRGDNYHVDGLSVSEKDKSYSYYVVAIDNAATEFKYADGSIINPTSNVSEYEQPKDINPGEAYPVINSSYNISGTTYKAKVSSVGVSSAVIEWTTNQNADSLVEYRKAGTSDKFIASGDTELVTNHSVTIAPLTANTSYEYRVRSVNGIGNRVEASGADVQPIKTADFSISAVKVETTTTTSKVTWNTPIASDSNVEYKKETTGVGSDSETSGDAALVTGHEVVIKALQPDTNYTYKIRSVTNDRFIAETGFLTFRTKPFDATQFVISPSASNIAEQNITATSAKIVWNTVVATSTWVDFGIESGSYNQSAGDEQLNTVHVVELKNLTPGVTYYYRVRGKDANQIEYTSQEYTFSAVLKPVIEGLKFEITSSYTAIISFNSNVDAEAVVSYGQGELFDLKAGTTAYKRNHTIELKDLEDGKPYTFYAEIKDKIGNVQKSQIQSFATPVDKEGARVSNVKVDILPIGANDETASVIISWVTDKPASTKIEYDEGAIGDRFGKTTIEDSTLSNTHTVIIKELNPATTYRYRILSKDKRDNVATSKPFTFVTPAKEKSILQLIIKSLEDTFSWTRNIGEFFRGVGKKIQ